MPELALSPLVATLLFILGCFAGYSYRRAWIAEAPVWRLWLYGLVAGGCLGLVAFVPLAV